MDSRSVTVFKINYFVKARRIATYVALGLLLVSFALRHVEILIWLRAIAWGVAGGFAAWEAILRKKINEPSGATWLNAALYFGFMILMLVRLR